MAGREWFEGIVTRDIRFTGGKSLKRGKRVWVTSHQLGNNNVVYTAYVNKDEILGFSVQQKDILIFDKII